MILMGYLLNLFQLFENEEILENINYDDITKDDFTTDNINDVILDNLYNESLEKRNLFYKLKNEYSINENKELLQNISPQMLESFNSSIYNKIIEEVLKEWIYGNKNVINIKIRSNFWSEFYGLNINYNLINSSEKSIIKDCIKDFSKRLKEWIEYNRSENFINVYTVNDVINIQVSRYYNVLLHKEIKYEINRKESISFSRLILNFISKRQKVSI